MSVAACLLETILQRLYQTRHDCTSLAVKQQANVPIEYPRYKGIIRATAETIRIFQEGPDASELECENSPVQDGDQE
jgi:hypothetical protein